MFADFKWDVKVAMNKVEGSTLRRLAYAAQSPSVHAMAVYRMGRWLNDHVPFAPLRILLKLPYFILHKLVEWLWGISIPGGARIGRGFFIGHFGGVIMHANVTVGEFVKINHQVTLGQGGIEGDIGWPTIGNYVYIGAGAKVLGGITVADFCAIGANAVLVDDLPAGTVAGGIPAKEIHRDGRRVVRDLLHLPEGAFPDTSP